MGFSFFALLPSRIGWLDSNHAPSSNLSNAVHLNIYFKLLFSIPKRSGTTFSMECFHRTMWPWINFHWFVREDEKLRAEVINKNVEFVSIVAFIASSANLQCLFFIFSDWRKESFSVKHNYLKDMFDGSDRWRERWLMRMGERKWDFLLLEQMRDSSRWTKLIYVKSSFFNPTTNWLCNHNVTWDNLMDMFIDLVLILSILLLSPFYKRDLKNNTCNNCITIPDSLEKAHMPLQRKRAK